MNPLIHFVKEGWKQSCNPHPLFNLDSYYSLNPDVRSSGKNPLVHYVTRGKIEGRLITLPDSGTCNKDNDIFLTNGEVTDKKTKIKIAVIIHIYHAEYIIDIFNYLQSLHYKYEYFISISGEHNRALYEKASKKRTNFLKKISGLLKTAVWILNHF